MFTVTQEHLTCLLLMPEQHSALWSVHFLQHSSIFTVAMWRFTATPGWEQVEHTDGNREGKSPTLEGYSVLVSAA